MTTLGERLRHYAKSQFGTIKAFGERVGMVSASLTPYLKGDRMPGTEVLQKFAGTGLNIHWLLTGDGEMLADRGDRKSGGRIVTPEEKGPSGRFVGTITVMDQRFGLTPIGDDESEDEENGEPEETEEE